MGRKDEESKKKTENKQRFLKGSASKEDNPKRTAHGGTLQGRGKPRPSLNGKRRQNA